MNAVGSTRPVQGPHAPLPNQGPVGPPSLLSSPCADADPSAGMAMLMKLMMQARERNLSQGQTEVQVNKHAKEAELAKQAAALKDQQDAADSAATWGVFGKIASVVALAVSAVAAVFTCGAGSALLVAAVALSAAAFAEQQFHIVGTLTHSDAASAGTSITLGVLSAICSFGASAIAIGASGAANGAATGASVSAKAAQAGAQASVTAGHAAETATQATASIGMNVFGCTAAASKAISVGSGVVNGGLQIVQGGLSAGSAAWNYASAEDAIDGKAAQQQAERIDRLIAWVIDGVKEASKSTERATQSLQGAMQTKNQTLVMASSLRG